MKIVRDCAYGARGERRLLLDTYQNERTNKQAAVILTHGGGWRAGNKEMMAPFAADLAARGFAAIAPQYSLLPEAAWPAPIEDLITCIQWTKANCSKLEIDPAKIALLGFSAGGQLALLAAGTALDRTFHCPIKHAEQASDVAAVVALYPAVDFQIGPVANGATAAERLLGERPSAAEARRASPLTHVSGRYPPTFLLHGASDHITSHLASLRMFEALAAAGAQAELHLYAGHTHEFVRVPSLLPLVQAEIGSFLERMVVDPQKHAHETVEFNVFARPLV